MVFESLVVDLINRFLGDYVENLDSSQLKLGIWGGDAVLQNLDVKESALNDLDLPVKIKAGHIGKLTLKIPWKNLYTAPVIAEIDGIYALAVPNASIKYNAEKEEKAKQDAKQKKLKQIEEAKKAEAEKDKVKDPKQDTFAEKLATQVIKNIQVRVSNIHVRYEDNLTNPKHPFAIGIMLEDLLFQTTNEKWEPTIIKEAVTQIYKLLKMDNLAVYWNSDEKMFQDMNKEDILPALKASFPSKEEKEKPTLQYLLKPISSIAHLKLNTKPEESKFSIPKIFLTLVFDDVSIGLNKSQYDNVLETLESLERMALLGIYRKYKPDVPLKGNVKKWWHYAYNSVLEETVRRRRKMWSWQNIKQHRKMMKSYRSAYIKKIDNKKVSSSDQKILDEGEKMLDVFSITIMRQQAEVEAAKLGAKKKEEKNTGWFGGWWGGSKKEKSPENDVKNEIKDKFYEMYTPEEKAKLYGAIGYSENEADPTFPKEFVAVRLVTKLSKVCVELQDVKKADPRILKLTLKDVFSSIGQRPAASAVSVEAKIDKLSVIGTTQNNVKPKMVLSQTKEKDKNFSLLAVNFETNPLDGSCDTRVKVKSRPLEITYDAITINQLASFFKPPEAVFLKQLSNAAMAKFDEIKEQSTAGLQHAIEQRKYTEISVDLMSSYVMVPEGGFMKQGVKSLVLDLGNLKVSTEKNQSLDLKTKVESMENLMNKAYDKFNITLDSIQLLFVPPGQDWQNARKAKESSMHLLKPMSILVDLHKCMFDKDPRMAKMKVFGTLPNIKVSISDDRLQQLISLVDSIPLPEPSPEQPTVDDILQGPNTLPSAVDDAPSTSIINKAIVDKDDKKKALHRTQSQEYVNATDLELKFEIKEIEVNIHEVEDNKEIPLMRLGLKSIGTIVKMRTFDMDVEAYLGGVFVQHQKFKVHPDLEEWLDNNRALKTGPVINLVNTNVEKDKMKNLLTVHYLNAKKNGPEFSTTYNNTEQSIDVSFAALELLLHQGAILSLLAFAQKLQPQSDSTSATTQKKKDVKAKAEAKKPAQRKKKQKPGEDKLIDVLVKAKLSMFSVAVCTEDKLLTDIKIKGIDANVVVQKAKTSVSALLQDITIFDPLPNSLYPKIMEIEGKEVLKLDVVVYNDGTEGSKYGDMSCMDTQLSVDIGCIKVVFLNRYVMDLLKFLDNFQAAKARIQEAGEAMAEYSKEVAATLQEKAPRVGMKINMKAPLIIVPQKSTSNNLLMMDLGDLSIANNFHLAGQKTSSGIPAVLDKMKIVLHSVKLSRALMLDSGQIKAECLILEPITISVDICRNLSAAWYHGHPEVDISGLLESVNVKMSQGDFAIIMKMTNENLSEGQDIGPPSDLPSIEAAEVKAGAVQSENAIDQNTSALVNGECPPAAKEVYSKMKFNFALKNLSATLYSGDSDMSGGLAKRKPERSLGKFALEGIMLNGEMMSDSSMVTKVILKDTILDDLRPAKQKGITRMITRSTLVAGGPSRDNMIDVDFTQNDKQDKDVIITVCSLKICVCVEFLMTLGDFFTKGLTPTPATAPPSAPGVETKTTSATRKDAPQTPPVGDMNIQFTIERPEIILIEDQLNNNTNVLVLDTEVMFKMRSTPDVQTMQASVSSLQIKSCTYNRREGPGIKILPPCDINMLSSAPLGKDHHIDVTITDVVFNISPATIRTMAAISSGFSVQKEDEDGSKKENVPADLWAIKKLTEDSFWFLKVPERCQQPPKALVANPAKPSDRGEQVPKVQRKEQLIVKLSSLLIKLEGGVGKRTVPLLIVESHFQGEVKNWSSQLAVEASLGVEVAYYNELLAVWEPLIEPVLVDGKTSRWELGLNVVANNDPVVDLDESVAEDGESNVDVVKVPVPAKMVIDVKSKDPLNITMTKTCLEVLGNLGKAFNDAYMLVEQAAPKDDVHSPYVFKNQTGLDLLLKLDTTFQSPENSENGRVKLASDQQLPTYEKPSSVMSLSPKRSVIKSTQQGVEKKIIFQVEQFGATREVTIKRAEKRLFQINQKSHLGDMWSIVSCTDSNVGQKIVSFRSIVQMCNNLEMPVEIFYKGDTKLESCGIAHPGDTFSVPLKAVYSLSGELFFKPLGGEFMESEMGFKWKDSDTCDLKQICCKNSPGQPSLYFNVCPKVEDIYFEATQEKSAKCYILELHPTVILHNLLPIPIKFLLEGSPEQNTLNNGENIPLFNASVNESTLELTLPNYRGREWTGKRVLKMNVPELSVWNFETFEGSTKIPMDLGLHCKVNNGSFDVTLFSPYWMINKTKQTLFYQGSDSDESIEHPPIFDGCILFAFKPKSMFSKKKAMLRIGEGTEWSDKFSLDTVGSAGTVQCKNKSEDRIYEVGVNISLTTSGLTKIITFTPFYILLNTADYMIQVAEVNDKVQDVNWIDVPPQECLPFWPEQKEMKLKAKPSGSVLATGPFLINKAHSSLLKLENEFGGILTECNVSESAMVTTFKSYKSGYATVNIVNFTSKGTIHYNQSGHPIIHTLNPEESCIYTWEDALGKLDLIWSCGKAKDMKNDLNRDDDGQFDIDSDTKVYWVSFLDGMQRVLLFTEDLLLATLAKEAGNLERMDQEINLSIVGMGLSLVNNYTQMEVAFMGITSSGIIWEEKKKKFKGLNQKTTLILEAAFQKHMSELAAGHSPPNRMQLDNKIEVDFSNKDKLMMIKPNNREIKRSFVDGIWLQYKASAHQLQMHAKLNRLQFDNQLNQAIFPTVLSPLPPPKSVAAESVPKPFIEASLLQRQHEYSSVTQVKYFRVLVQEMALNVDQGFLNAMLELFAADQPVSREQESKLFVSDMKKIDDELLEVVGVSLVEEQKKFYDDLHFSPIKVHLSFSLQSGSNEDGKPTEIKSNILNVFLQSVGVVLTDVQDVVFKLGYFERKHTFYNQPQLVNEMTRHYAGQAIKQMYVLVLGLDVLGNPFGLLRGLSEGVGDLFYEPYQGLIQGPEEFAEGMVLGVRSLFGHAIGGAAGAASRITGTVGKGLATLTMDDAYQKKRREQLNKKPATATEGFARGGKGLVTGVFDGVTGIVRKPIEGAQKEGVGGFFKGVGKGLVGAVTRPTSGVIDFASSSLEGIKRITDMNEEIRRLRPPRRFHSDHVIRPYNHQEAEGYAILMETMKGKFATTDEYQAHVVVGKDRRTVFIVTDLRVLMVKKGELFGAWDCDWTYTWEELKERPKRTSKGLELILKEKEKKKFFGSSASKKEIPVADEKVLEWIIIKIEEAMARQK